MEAKAFILEIKSPCRLVTKPSDAVTPESATTNLLSMLFRALLKGMRGDLRTATLNCVLAQNE